MRTLRFPIVLFISFHAIASFSQEYENLVFEGGGIRGIAYCGALETLQKENALKNLKRVAGTSVGAIQATMVALNYTPDEMATIISDLNLKEFNDGKLIFFGGSHRLWNHYGWYRGDKLLHWIGHLLHEKTGNSDITFKQLHDLAVEKGYKDLYITGTNLSRQSSEMFSRENYPNMKVKDAVRISVSIPMYYRAAFMDSLGNVTYAPKKNISYNVLVDGGLLENFPIHVFDSTKYISSSADSNRYEFNPKTLGIRLDSKDQIIHDQQNKKGLAPFKITGFKTYASAFYNIIIENLNRQKLTSKDWERTISIDTEGVPPRVKRISPKVKEVLIESGRAGAHHFLDQ